MTMTAREAFEKGTATFNAHDLDGFAEILADNVVFKAPGGIHGEGKEACAAFFGSWFAAFPDARVEVHAVHNVDDIVVEEGTQGNAKRRSQRSNGGRSTDGPLRRSGLYPRAPLSRRQACLVQSDV